MASGGVTATTLTPTQQEAVDYLADTYPDAVAGYDDMYYGDGSEDEGDGVDDGHVGIRLSRLSIESSDSDADTDQLSEDKKKKADSDDDDDDNDIITLGFNSGLSLPGTPVRYSPRRRGGSERLLWVKEYASETEAREAGNRGQKKRSGGAGDGDRSSYYHRRARERRLERAWEMRRCHCTHDGAGSHSGGSSPCVVVRPRGRGSACMCMDMDEVKACRDLGLELPCDWTVEIPPAAFHADTSSGGDSPVGSWCISSPGDDPRDVKARLRVWAQAVALASASRLSS